MTKREGKKTRRKEWVISLQKEPTKLHRKLKPRFIASRLIGPHMYQPMLISRVDLVPVLVVEQRRDIFQGFSYGAMDRRTARFPSSSRADRERRIAGGDFRDAFPRQNVANIDRSNS